MEYTIQTKKEIYENDLFTKVRDYLTEVQKLEAQIIETTEGFVLQARERTTWKKYTGMGVALTMKLQSSCDLLIVEFGETKWLDKAAAGAAGLFLFAPLFVTGAIGAYRQSTLPKKILDFIKKYVKEQEYIESQKNDESLVCPRCNKVNSSVGLFCSFCGSKLQEKCTSCGADVEVGARFCNSCGVKLNNE